MQEETISFNYLKSLFDEEVWDVSVIDGEGLKKAALHPIKRLAHVEGEDFTSPFDHPEESLTNTLVLARQGHSYDYTHYEEAVMILHNYGITNWAFCYTNFKEAAILAGLGVRARNSLIYSYKFGFDCHFAAIRFGSTITDFPKEKRVNYKLWNRCKGCDDCAKACPVGAIHNEGENPLSYWLDSKACDDMIAYSDHPTIPSIKKFWHKHVHPEIPKEVMDQVKRAEEAHELAQIMGASGPLAWDANGFTFDGQVVRKDGNPIDVPVCRECTSQPRCSKWGGKFPYEKIEDKNISLIDLLKDLDN